MPPISEQADDALGSMPTTNTSAYANHSVILTAFDRFASRVTRWAGSPVAFALALASVALWAALGRYFDYSENWQLVINTGITIVTFLMVFMIQQSQNKDSIALHLKLNELLAASKQASNRMISIEDLDEQDLRDVVEFYVRLAARAKHGGKGEKRTPSTKRECQPTGSPRQVKRHRPRPGRVPRKRVRRLPSQETTSPPTNQSGVALNWLPEHLFAPSPAPARPAPEPASAAPALGAHGPDRKHRLGLGRAGCAFGHRADRQRGEFLRPARCGAHLHPVAEPGNVPFCPCAGPGHGRACGHHPDRCRGHRWWVVRAVQWREVLSGQPVTNASFTTTGSALK